MSTSLMGTPPHGGAGLTRPRPLREPRPLGTGTPNGCEHGRKTGQVRLVLFIELLPRSATGADAGFQAESGDHALRPGRIPERLATGHGQPELVELHGGLARVDPRRPPRRADRPPSRSLTPASVSIIAPVPFSASFSAHVRPMLALPRHQRPVLLCEDP